MVKMIVGFDHLFFYGKKDFQDFPKPTCHSFENYKYYYKNRIRGLRENIHSLKMWMNLSNIVP